MNRVHRSIGLWWTLLLCLTIFGFGAESKPTLAHDKPNADSPNLVQMAKEVKGIIVQIEVPLHDGKTNLASGFWVNEHYVATCWHVVRTNPTATLNVKSAVDTLFDLKNNNVISANWEVFSAKVVAKDEKNDLALLKVEENPFEPRKVTPIKFGNKVLVAHYKQAFLKTELPEAGQKILWAGYPLGGPYLVVQEGTVASVAHDLPGLGPTFKILISTVANPGNSGGPVLDPDNKVIGILEAELVSSLGQSGIAVAVPALFVSELMNTVNK
jgi:S1-C subfamily serine protease